MILKKYLFILCYLIATISVGQNYNFKRFSVEEGLSEPGLYCLEEDGRGELWIGLENGGVSIFDGTNFRPLRTDIDVGNDIRAIFKSSLNEMWIGSAFEGISIIGSNNNLKINLENGLSSNHIRCLTEDKEGRIWAGTVGGGIAVVENKKVVATILDKDGLSSNNVKSLLTTKDGKIWAGTTRGVAVYDGLKLVYKLTNNNGLSSNEILSLAEDHSGNVWIGTNKGLCVFKNGKVIKIKSIPDRTRIKSILVDRKDQVWIGTRLGVAKIVSEKVLNRNFSITWFTKKNGLSNNRVRCLYEDQSGAIWIGTYFGGINTLFNESFSLYNQGHGLTDDAVSMLRENAIDSTLWLGIYGAGINVFNKGVVHSISTNEGLSNNYINDVLHLNSHGTVVATDEGINLINHFEVVEVIDSYNGFFKNNMITHVAGVDSLCIGLTADHEVFAIKIGEEIKLDSLIQHQIKDEISRNIDAIYLASSRIWFVTDSILYQTKITGEKLMFEKKWGLAGVQSIVAGQNQVYGFTKKNILFSIGDQLQKIDSFPTSKEIRFIVKDNRDAIWLGVDQKMQRIILKGNQVVSRKSYGFSEGFIGMQSFKNAAVISANSELWVGTIKGLLNIKDKAYQGVKRDLKVYFSGLYTGNDLIDIQRYSRENTEGVLVDLELPYNMNQLNFRAKVFHLKNVKEVEYKYVVSGDEDIIQVGGADNIVFNLNPGDYQLSVFARTQWGNWSTQPLQFDFSITQPFWYNPSFIIGIICFIVAVVFLSLNYRTRKLEKEKANLEAVVFERTEELIVEQQKSEDLLLNILPRGIAKELKSSGTARTRKYKNASVLFTDFKGFTTFSSKMDPNELVRNLDEVFGEFDVIIERNNLEKIKTIGDAYMCASGIPDEDDAHAINIVKAAFEIVEVMERFNEKKRATNDIEWPVRVGIHSGELIAGVVGKKKFAYDIWGDTVNIASRMESNSEPGKINISRATKDLISNEYSTEFRGEIEAKNRGSLEMYFVTGKS